VVRSRPQVSAHLSPSLSHFSIYNRVQAASEPLCPAISCPPLTTLFSPVAINFAHLPAPLHLQISSGSILTPLGAQSHLTSFLNSETAARVLAGTGGAATRVALVRLLEALKEESANEVKDEGEGKKKKRRKSEKGADKESSKRRKVTEDK
jgi:hypothetical protein